MQWYSSRSVFYPGDKVLEKYLKSGEVWEL